MRPDRPSRHVRVLGAVGAAVAAACLLLLFPPEQYSFYPRCPLYTTFGLLCPGCGGTRAIAALLRGHLREAVRCNALVTWALLLGLPASTLCMAAGHRWPACQASLVRLRQPAALAALLAAVLFGVWRNLHG